MKQQDNAIEDAADKDGYIPDQLRTRLSSSYFGRVLEYKECVTSTNDMVLNMARNGAPEGTVCLANEQTAGRGRRGFEWFSPPGCGIWASFLLRPQLAIDCTPPLTLCAAGAVARALEAFSSVDVAIKWPNDLLIRDRKVAGILAETHKIPNNGLVIIVGIGINVNQSAAMFPPEIADSATSLKIESGMPIPRQNLFLAIAEAFRFAYHDYLDSGPKSMLAEIDTRLAWRRKLVTADSPAGTVGRVSQINQDGALVLETENHERVIIKSGSIRLSSEQ